MASATTAAPAPNTLIASTALTAPTVALDGPIQSNRLYRLAQPHPPPPTHRHRLTHTLRPIAR
jgi:hypothetical protein